MRPTTACYELIKSFEGFSLAAYPDPKTGGDPWTIGWGSTGPGIEEGTVWKQSQAAQRLAVDVCRFADYIDQNVKVPLTQGQYNALTSLVYNVGPGRAGGRDGIITLRSGEPSTLLRKLNAGDYSGARTAFLSWVSPGSNVENGLRRRRRAELALWDTP